MTKIVVFNSVTLDGVMQAPGRPDEDRRGGFRHGGWAAPHAPEGMAQAPAAGLSRGGGDGGRWRDALRPPDVRGLREGVAVDAGREPIRAVPQRGPEARGESLA